MLLVPRQLLRSGMTGTVPYYGGRLLPAQAYAASHPGQPVPASLMPPSFAGRGPAAPPPPPPAGPGRPGLPPAAHVAALEQLRDAGVITPAEFDQLRARVGA